MSEPPTTTSWGTPHPPPCSVKTAVSVGPGTASPTQLPGVFQSPPLTGADADQQAAEAGAAVTSAAIAMTAVTSPPRTAPRIAEVHGLRRALLALSRGRGWAESPGARHGEDRERVMSDTETSAAEAVGERDQPDKSPRVANRENVVQRAEVSNFDIVNHYFTVAADRLGHGGRRPRAS